MKKTIAAAALAASFAFTSVAQADEPSATTEPPPLPDPAATATATAPAPPAAAEPAPPPPRRQHTPVGPIVVVTVGGVGVFAGLFAHALGSSKEHDADTTDDIDETLHGAGLSGVGGSDKLREKAQDYHTAGNFLMAGGLVVAASGAIWWVIDASIANSKKSALRVTPALGPTHAGAAFTGTF